MTLSRRIVAECLGTAFLLAAVIGSGVMGEGLTGGRQYRHSHACQYTGNGRYLDNPDFHARANLGRALQLGGNACGCRLRAGSVGAMFRRTSPPRS